MKSSLVCKRDNLPQHIKNNFSLKKIEKVNTLKIPLTREITKHKNNNNMSGVVKRYNLIFAFKELKDGLFKTRFEFNTRISAVLPANDEVLLLDLIRNMTVEGTSDEVCRKYIQQIEDEINNISPDSVLDVDTRGHFILCCSDKKCMTAKMGNELIAWYTSWKNSSDGTVDPQCVNENETIRYI